MRAIVVCIFVVVVVAGCSVDLRPQQAAVAALKSDLAATGAAQHALSTKIEARIGGLPNVAADDAAGAALRKAVDDDKAAYVAALAAFDADAAAAAAAADAGLAAEDRGAVDDAVAAATQTLEQQKRGLADKSNATIRAIEALRRHIEAQKDRANEAVRAAAAVERAAERVVHKGGEIAFDVAFKDDSVVEGDVGFSRLLDFAKTCEALRFELIGVGESRRARARAESVKAQLEKQKAKNRAVKVSTRAGEDGVVVVVQRPCPEGGYVDD